MWTGNVTKTRNVSAVYMDGLLTPRRDHKAKALPFLRTLLTVSAQCSRGFGVFHEGKVVWYLPSPVYVILRYTG